MNNNLNIEHLILNLKFIFNNVNKSNIECIIDYNLYVLNLLKKINGLKSLTLCLSKKINNTNNYLYSLIFYLKKFCLSNNINFIVN